MIFAVFDVLLAVNMCINYSFFTFMKSIGLVLIIAILLFLVVVLLIQCHYDCTIIQLYNQIMTPTCCTYMLAILENWYMRRCTAHYNVSNKIMLFPTPLVCDTPYQHIKRIVRLQPSPQWMGPYEFIEFLLAYCFLFSVVIRGWMSPSWGYKRRVCQQNTTSRHSRLD